MVNSFNFPITNDKPLSKLCHENELSEFQEACNCVRNLPYGRNTNKEDLSLVLLEGKGTCSTKHAFLSAIAMENEQNAIKLYIGIYRMNQENTPGIGNTLKTKELEYIPEAHTYLKYQDTIMDYTSKNPSSFSDHLLYEEEILPNQINDYKTKLHKAFMSDWLIDENIHYSLDDIWHIREQCILNLSK